MAEMRTWQEMVESNAALLKRKTGDDAPTWTARARAAGIGSPATLKTWLNEQQVTGYSSLAVEWEMFGTPEFMLQGSAELIDGQYADRQTPRRKFAQNTPATKSAVDLLLRIQPENTENNLVESVKVAAGDPFNHRVRLRSADEMDDEVFRILEAARKQNDC